MLVKQIVETARSGVDVRRVQEVTEILKDAIPKISNQSSILSFRCFYLPLRLLADL
jgi:hypothetical protein